MAVTNPIDLAVHDVLLRDVTRLGLQGAMNYIKQLTFYVGSHGPFVVEWPTVDFDANKAKKAMQDQVAELRLLTSA